MKLTGSAWNHRIRIRIANFRTGLGLTHGSCGRIFLLLFHVACKLLMNEHQIIISIFWSEDRSLTGSGSNRIILSHKDCYLHRILMVCVKSILKIGICSIFPSFTANIILRSFTSCIHKQTAFKGFSLTYSLLTPTCLNL